MERSKEIARWTEYLVSERDGAALYDAMAAREADEKVSEVFRRLAVVERKHARRWARKLEEAGAPVPPEWRSGRTRLLIWLIRRFGVSPMLPTVMSLEQAGSADYGRHVDSRDLVKDEQSHHRVLRQIARSSSGGLEGSTVAKIEGRHRTAGGNALRAAVLGWNDGLVSNLSLVMAVAGANLPASTILITGLAGLVAGAGSMALGEWLSVQSSRELYERQIAMEEAEIAEAPEEEAEELALIYEARGMSEADAKALADRIMEDPDQALDALTREELGIDPDSLGGSAWTAAVASFVLFALGALIPVIPYFFLEGKAALVASAGLSAVGLFAIGAAITLFTGRSVLFSGGRQLLFGLVAAALTFGIGRLLGVSIAG
ncbi:MAG TPA: VIT1/CCC1 transporter family protein [Thermoanaerobaculia bacterium]|nr:VIT1/CCC1 transporter family protein [Thermoanaerobaculia bacterium]